MPFVGDVSVSKEVAELLEHVEELLRRVVVDRLHLRRRHVVHDEEGHLESKRC